MQSYQYEIRNEEVLTPFFIILIGQRGFGRTCENLKLTDGIGGDGPGQRRCQIRNPEMQTNDGCSCLTKTMFNPLLSVDGCSNIIILVYFMMQMLCDPIHIGQRTFFYREKRTIRACLRTQTDKPDGYHILFILYNIYSLKI